MLSALMRVRDRHHAGRAERVPADGRVVRVLSLPRPWQEGMVRPVPGCASGPPEGLSGVQDGNSAGAALTYHTLQ